MDAAAKRKHSPRAPGVSLDDAIARVGKIYKEEGRHISPVEVVVKHLGYSGINGAATAMIASLRYWGLIERPKEGHLVVTKDFEDYQFTPDEAHKRALLIRFMRTPSLYAELLDKYEGRLPSDANIKFDLIQKGFTPVTADACLTVFKRSIEFSRYFDLPAATKPMSDVNDEDVGVEEQDLPKTDAAIASGRTQSYPSSGKDTGEMYRIPVKLVRNRVAWLEFPTPFFMADKERLKAFINLHLADDEEDEAGQQDEQ